MWNFVKKNRSLINGRHLYSQSRTGTNMQQRLMRGNLFEFKLYSPPHEPPLYARSSPAVRIRIRSINQFISQENTFGFGPSGCQDCECHPYGSASLQCSPSGQCSCLANVTGLKCAQCLLGFYGLPEMPCAGQKSFHGTRLDWFVGFQFSGSLGVALKQSKIYHVDIAMKLNFISITAKL